MIPEDIAQCEVLNCKLQCSYYTVHVHTMGCPVRVRFQREYTKRETMTEKLRSVRVDCDYWYPEKEECMKMTAALVEFGAVNYHATMKGQPRSCCGNKIGCYLTRESRAFVRQK